MENHTYTLPTDTRHVKIRSRQYDLFNKDLGEGFERQKALVVAIIVGGWAVMMLIAGAPLLSSATVAIYVAPPALLSFFAVKEDAGGRPAYASWWDRFRFLFRRGRPLVPHLGRAQGPVPLTVRTPKIVVLDVDRLQAKGSR